MCTSNWINISANTINNQSDFLWEWEYSDVFRIYIQNKISRLLQNYSEKNTENDHDSHVQIFKLKNYIKERYGHLANDPDRQITYLRLLTYFTSGKLIQSKISALSIRKMFLNPKHDKWIFLDKILRDIKVDSPEISVVCINHTVKHEHYWTWNYITLESGNTISRWFLTETNLHEISKNHNIRNIEKAIGTGSYRWWQTLDDIERR